MTKPTVFISYDGEAARRLYLDLKKARVQPWLDSECLLPGQHWRTEIRKAIEKAHYFLALLSSRSVGKRGYVQKELRQALEVLGEMPAREIYLIQARLEDCRPAHSELEELQWVDLFPEYEPGLEKILRVIRPQAAVSSGRLSFSSYDPEVLEQAGWGVVVPEGVDPALKAAMQPLLAKRRSQCGDLYRELQYRPGDSARAFLARYGVAPGVVDPTRLPLSANPWRPCDHTI